MTNDHEQAMFISLSTMMVSLSAHYLVTREMPTEYLSILAQDISSVLQELDGVDEVEPMLPDEEDEHEHGC